VLGRSGRAHGARARTSSPAASAFRDRLGVGDATDRLTPTRLPVTGNWRSVSAGIYTGFAIRDDGSLWGWGTDAIGNGSVTVQSVPVQVGSSSAWNHVSVSYDYVLATQSDGSLWSWGTGSTEGELGLGDTNERLTPTRVGDASDWVSLPSALFVTSFATDASGESFGWGYNSSGQAGVGDVTNPLSPASLGTGWQSITNAFDLTVALRRY
jgi:alpha-tubulin suppressor-like RCC1 family protein